MAQDRAYVDAEIISIESSADQAASKWDEPSVRLALGLYLNAADLWRTKRSFNNSAANLRRAVRLKMMLNEGRSALELLDQASRMQAKIGGSAETAKNIGLYSEVWLSLNNFDKSEYYQKKTLKTAIVTGQNSLVARSYLTEAAIRLNKQNFSAMESPLQKSLEIYRRLGDRDGESEVLTEMAYCATLNNDRVRARELAEESLRIARDNGLLRRKVFALIALGDANQRIGDWQSAMAAFREADRDFPQKLDLYERAILVNRIGFYYLTYGNLDKAKEFLIESNELFETLGRASACSELQSILGEIATAQTNFDQAIVHFRKSRQYSRQSGTAIAFGTLNQKIGEAQFGLGHLSEAERLLTAALLIWEKLGVNFRTAEVRQTLGMIFERRRAFSRAQANFEQALHFNRLVRNKVGQAQDYYNLARLDNEQGLIDTSLENIERSIELTELTLNETTNGSLRVSFSSSVSDRYDLFIRLLMAKHIRNRDQALLFRALQVSERARARALLENLSLSDSSFLSDAPAELIQKEKATRWLLNNRADMLIQAMGNGGESENTKKLEGEIAEFEDELEEIKAELKEKSPIYSAIKNPAPFDVGEFQAQVLDDDSLLLEFSLGKEESYLWVVGKTTFDSYVLAPREQIESRIERLRGLLKQGSMLPDEAVDVFQKRIADAEAEYSREARALSNELLGQTADKLAGKRLIVVADGKIHYFPLAALPLPNSTSDEPILLTNEVVYEPSAAALMIIKKISASGKVPQKDLFLVSDPVFSKIDDRLEQGGTGKGFVATVLGTFRSFDSLESLPRLPASLDEARSITDVVGEAATTARTGFAANRENVLNSGIADYKTLHFATHGLVDEKRPELSGIVLSLFDEAGNQQDGGFIRLQDVYGMNLNADLVVLSACDTGLGKEIKGEGLMSLNNAFLQAGAKSVVSSLWKVDDIATKELMTEFYRGMASENLTSSEALRRAQIKLRSDPRFSSPLYWASFTAQGNFNTAPQFSRGYNVWIFALGLVLISMFGIYWIRKARKRRSQVLSR